MIYDLKNLPVNPPPATPNRDPTTVAPATEPIAVNIADDPMMLLRPAPMNGAAIPPVIPIMAPPPMAAMLIRA